MFELERFLGDNQHYLEIMYKALFALGYYGLVRISELCYETHEVKACNVHAASNKEKLLLMLYTSKTHGKGSRPQKIKITSNRTEENTNSYTYRHFCPFNLVKCYMEERGNYDTITEPFFIFRDRSPVKPAIARNMLKTLISRLGLEANLYGFHSLRIGRVGDLIKFSHYSVEELKRIGRWKSNAVYKYIKL